MGAITIWLSDEELEALKKIQKLQGKTGNIHGFIKEIVLEYLQGKIRNLAIEKAMKEVVVELETQRKVLLDLQMKIEEKTEGRDNNKEVKELLEEVLEKIEKFQTQSQGQGQGQNQSSRTTNEIFDILIALKELGIRVLLMSDKRKSFEDIIDELLSKYK